ncbi:MAG: methyltransferase domain-containing protein [Desulfomonile tiedjei]|nr:methyltransferase domain-containing protein [Desulfomonile tiedjei]
MEIAELVYQYGYSEHFSEYQYDEERQAQKARKALSVLEDFCGGPGSLEALTLLDLGCSAGLMTRLYSRQFQRTVGVDIDAPAVRHAAANFSTDKLQFLVRDAMDTGLPAESFDVVTCTHIYEHVPDFKKLMAEIGRVLKKGGICYFAAQNRLSLIEPHYGLPLLSVVPKPIAHIYFRLFGKGDHYYETMLTLGKLRELAAGFECHDYTLKIMSEPVKYHATELLTPGSLKQGLALAVARLAYFLCPTYVWILRK